MWRLLDQCDVVTLQQDSTDIFLEMGLKNFCFRKIDLEISTKNDTENFRQFDPENFRHFYAENFRHFEPENFRHFDTENC